MQIPNSVLQDIFSFIDCNIHIKDIKSGKYTETNDQNLRIFGSSKRESILGMSIFDLDILMGANWDVGFADRIDKIDKMVGYILKTVIN